MTCFWDGILAKLAPEDKKILRLDNLGLGGVRAKELVVRLKCLNRKTPDMTWQGTKLSAQQLQENLTHIDEHRADQIQHGYWCSACEPYLFLLGQLLRVHIDHCYAGHTVQYRYLGGNPTGRTLQFRSSRTHFT